MQAAGEEEAFCSRAVVVRAGPGCPAPAAPAEDNEPLLEAAVSSLCAVEECPPETRWMAAASLKDSSEGSSSLLSPNRGVSPPRGEPPVLPSHSLGHKMLQGCSAPHTHPGPCEGCPAHEARDGSGGWQRDNVGSPHATKQHVSPCCRRQPQLNHPPEIPRTKDPFSSGFAGRVTLAPTRRLPALPP